VQSPIFGIVELQSLETDGGQGDRFITAGDFISIQNNDPLNGRDTYIFDSPGSSQSHNCRTANLQDMVDVFNSFAYLKK
jgi:hypothetical protein